MAIENEGAINDKLFDLAAQLKLVKEEKYLKTGDAAALKAYKASVTYATVSSRERLFDLKIFRGQNGAIRFGKAYRDDDDLVLTIYFDVRGQNPIVRRLSAYLILNNRRYYILENVVFEVFNKEFITTGFKENLVKALLTAARSE